MLECNKIAGNKASSLQTRTGVENSNPDRKEYNLFTNNCGTFASEVVKQDPDVKEKAPVIIDPRPNSIVDEYQNDFQGLHYNPKTTTTKVDPKIDKEKK